MEGVGEELECDREQKNTVQWPGEDRGSLLDISHKSYHDCVYWS